MGRSFYTLSALIGFLSGTLLYLAVRPGFFVLGAVFSAAILAFAVFRQFRFCLVLLFIAAAALGLFRARMTEHIATPDSIDFYNGREVVLEGVIAETDVRRDKAKYKLRITSYELKIDGESVAVSGAVLISMPKYPQYRYGDLVRAVGTLEAPGVIDGFSYEDYLSRYGIYSVMTRPKVTVLAGGQGHPFWHAMTFLQGMFMDKINRLFPEPHGSLEAGLLVGARKGISPELMEAFNVTGLTHIIAISGYNITIIITFVMWFLAALPRRFAFAVALTAIVLFTLFVGASPAVTRASIMGILGLLALNAGRQNHLSITVLLSAALMVFYNPKILWWDVGFQLSFAAVLGLIYVAPLFEQWSEKLPPVFGIREAILMTLSAQVMALPIILYNFGRLSLIAPLANLLVAFAIPPAMFFGFGAVVFSFIFYPFAWVFAYVAWAILTYIIGVIGLLSAVPYASVTIAGMSLWLFFGYYFLLALFLFWHSRKNRLTEPPSI